MRSPRGIVAAALAVVPLLFGCSVSSNGVAAPREVVEATIDQKLPTVYHEAAPGLPLGHAHCPDGLMELGNGNSGHCTFDIGSLSIPIVVTLGGNNDIEYAPQAFLIDMRHVETYLGTELLREYGVNAAAGCSDPRYRIATAGDRFTCAVKGKTYAGRATVKVLANGRFFLYNPPGLTSPAAALMQPSIAAHEAGKPVVVSGKTLEAALATTMAAYRAAGVRSGLVVGDVRCPATVDLSGSKRAQCLLDVSGKTIRLSFWIEGGGWHVETVDLAMSRAAVERAATAYYDDLERNNGFSVRVSVRCPWPSVLVVTPPAARDCTLLAGKQKRRMSVRFADRAGTVSYFVY